MSCVGCVLRSVSCDPRMLWGPHDAGCNKTHTGDQLAAPFWLLRDTFICHGTIIWFRGTHKFVIEYPEHAIDVRQFGSSVSLSWSDSRTRWSEHYTNFTYVQVRLCSWAVFWTHATLGVVAVLGHSEIVMFVVGMSKIVYFTGWARSRGIHSCKWEDNSERDRREVKVWACESKAWW
jgi:hypothetical protein